MTTSPTVTNRRTFLKHAGLLAAAPPPGSLAIDRTLAMDYDTAYTWQREAQVRESVSRDLQLKPSQIALTGSPTCARPAQQRGKH